MSRLAAEFGISGNGLAKICDRLEIPYPPRGYWAKKEAGKPIVTYKLPPRPDGIPEFVDIHPTPPKPAPPPEAKESMQTATAAVSAIKVPETLDDLHPKVKAWLEKHKREQREREQENRRRKRDDWGWPRPLLDDLTERDLYRFRVSSAIFKAVEKAGGKVDDAPITGKVTFLVSSQKVDCSIIEKMVKPVLPPEGDTARWTAYPHHHQSGLHSSGFLRVTITTYLSGKQPQWIETPEKKIEDWLVEIIATIIGAGPILVEQKRQREEAAQRHREEEARRYERQRLKEIDERRWTRFRERAADWEERARLLDFVAELRKRLETEGDTQIADLQLSEWIVWTQERIENLDPLRHGLAGLFGSIVAADRGY